MRVKRIHHLTVAVRDVEIARETFETLFSASAEDARDIQSFGVRARDVHAGEDVLQIAAPLGANSPLMRFIERRGEGFYNLALEVEDLDGAVAELSERGIKVSEPIEATPGLRSAFVTMTATHGLSLQLVEVADREDRAQEANQALLGPDDEVASGDVPSPGDRTLDLTPDEWSDTD